MKGPGRLHVSDIVRRTRAGRWYPEGASLDCRVAARGVRPETDEHHSVPAGVVSHAAAAGAWARLYRMSGTSFVLGCCSAAASDEVRDYDAVLDCSLQGRHQAVPAASKEEQLSSMRSDAASAASGLAPASHSSSAQSPCEHIRSSAEVQQPSASQPPAYLWLPVKSSKLDRQGLQRQLPAALAFLEAHRRAARTVLVCDDDGCDSCVSVVVAALACEGKARCAEEPNYEQLSARMAAAKASVRKHLAEVSREYPLARPTRGSLKQVARMCCDYV